MKRQDSSKKVSVLNVCDIATAEREVLKLARECFEKRAEALGQTGENAEVVMEKMLFFSEKKPRLQKLNSNF